MELEVEKYKLTDIGFIPSDWEAIRIENVCKLINGRGFKPFEWEKQGLPIIRIQNLNGSDDYNFYNGAYDKKIEVENGQLLFAWSGSIGTSFGPHIWFGEKGVLNYHTWKIFVDEDVINKDYFLHALKQLTKFIEEQAHGASALVHVQKWEMEKFYFPFTPNKTEQTAIATALTDTDNYITHIEKLIAKKRLIKQGAMQELLRPKEGWVVKKLGEIAEIATGTTPPTKDLDNYGDEYCFVSPADLGEFKFITRTEKKLSKKGFHLSRKFPQKSILFTCIGSTIGKMGIASFEMTSNQQINAVMPNDLYSTEFMYYYLLLIADQIKSSATEQAVPMINKTEFQKIAIQFPTLIEQIRISMILSDLDEELTALELQLAKAQNIKQGMMQQLLTGKIRLV